VNRLLKQFLQMDKMLRKMKGGGLRKMLAALSRQHGGGGWPR
jgi:signal recognition particle subunit SRP54